MRDLGVADGPVTLAKLGAISSQEIIAASARDPVLNFDATVDGWVLTEQPATTLAQGRQTKVPVIVGSNSDEGTTMVEEDLRVAPTLANYKAFLKSEFVNDADADEIFRAYPAARDADVRRAFIAFDTDYGFGFSAYRFAVTAARAGQKT
jgi:para-nitrobenzyl esterase